MAARVLERITREIPVLQRSYGLAAMFSAMLKFIEYAGYRRKLRGSWKKD